ncbi:hypothetical protein [Brevibacterium atlanticum]|uniref:hypothetical protein n=1 Tax=Brevibacterium atlanticum TaxID=2697563 RepID=UPI0014234420|nr:hypothetical protein [Brevibacterium atlanticum]
MFRQFSYRLIPFLLGLIVGAPHRRGGSTRTEVTDRGFAAEVDSRSGPHPGEDPDAGAEYDPPDRGDVPGWVLITLMTAGLVVALWALAGEAFTSMFQDAMNKVRGAG